MSVNSKMTAIANAVRDLRGMSGIMGLDAMATNINGAKTAVDAALAALTEKGVTVPDGTKVDGLAALIAAIEAGGDGGTQINTGTITFAEDTATGNTVLIEHNSGFIPRIFLIYTTSSSNRISAMFLAFVGWLHAAPEIIGTQFSYLTCGYNNATTTTMAAKARTAEDGGTLSAVTTNTWNQNMVFAMGHSTNAKYQGGRQYKWIAISDWEGNF